MKEKFEKLNRVINYIENHLEEEMSMKNLALIAGCSEFDFQRLFSFLCDVSPSTYIRRRRMSQAGEDLKKGHKVTDVALRYGYYNPVSFTRLFKELFGILPSETKNFLFDFNIFPKLELSILIKEDYKMKYRIVKTMTSCNFLGVEKTFSNNKLNLIPKFWNKLQKSGAYNYLNNISTEFPHEKDYYKKCGINICGVHSISIPESQNKERCIIGAFSDNSNITEYNRYVLTPAEYLVVSGDFNFEKIWQDIEKWLATSTFKRDNKPYLEIYGTTLEGNNYAEIWIPITKCSFQIKRPDEIKDKNKENEYVLLPDFKFIGKTLLCNTKKLQEIGKFWTSFTAESSNNDLLKLPEIFKGFNMFSGISITKNHCKEKNEFLYCIGVFTTKDAPIPNGFDVYNFPSTIAVYSNLGIHYEEMQQKAIDKGMKLSYEDNWNGELYSCDEPLMDNGQVVFHRLFPVKYI